MIGLFKQTYVFFQAKQRASIKWLLAKAYNHKTPQELREPFYKDHDVSKKNVILRS